MCTDCYTREIRKLVVVPNSNWYYTLRIGEAMGDESPVVICGPQEEVAGFDFHEVNKHGIPIKPATTESDPSVIRAFLRVIKPADWARFLCFYAASLEKDHPELEEIVRDLETEATGLYHEAIKEKTRVTEFWDRADEAIEGPGSASESANQEP